MGLAENAGRPWSRGEEAELLRAFEAGTTIAQLARQHGRTLQAIQGRLYRLGKVPDWRLMSRPGSEAEGVRTRQEPPGQGASAPASVQVRLDGLNAAAQALVRADFSPDELPTILRVEVASLQRDLGQEVDFRDGTDGIWFTFNSRRPCGSVRVRKPKEVRFLSGKIAGVWMVVNLHKPGVYRHENAAVAAALRALAEAIEGAEVALADQDIQLRVGG
jgi:hypothetical protein